MLNLSKVGTKVCFKQNTNKILMSRKAEYVTLPLKNGKLIVARRLKKGGQKTMAENLCTVRIFVLQLEPNLKNAFDSRLMCYERNYIRPTHQVHILFQADLTIF